VDQRMRLLAKWDTARYGDRVQVDGGGTPIQIVAPIAREGDAREAVLNGNGNGKMKR